MAQKMREDIIKKLMFDAYWEYLNALNISEMPNMLPPMMEEDKVKWFEKLEELEALILTDLQGEKPADESVDEGWQGLVWQLEWYEDGATIVITAYFADAWYNNPGTVPYASEADRLKYVFAGIKGEEIYLAYPLAAAENI